jgi:hypothetical protein
VRRGLAPILACQPWLLWPALWNGYPLLFSDSGTYISQIVERHLGWDRPPFYALAVMLISLRLSLWPVVLAQGLLTGWVLHLLGRALWPGAWAWSLPVLAAVLGLVTALPWVTAEIMPDFLTALMAVALWLLLVRPEGLRRVESWGLVFLVAGAIACHQANWPIAAPLGVGLALVRRQFGAQAALTRGMALQLLAGPALGIGALVGANLIGHGRLALSPYGDVFLLARLVGDGPARLALARDCPEAGWRLCRFRTALSATADDFLWRADSPLYAAGGPKRLAPEAGQIVRASLREAPGMAMRAAASNAFRQFATFGTAPRDELEPWPLTAGRAVANDLPLDRRAFAAARQTMGSLGLPAWWRVTEQAIGGAGILGCVLASVASWRRDRLAAGFCVTVLVLLLANAVLLGALSGPHARYQSRVVWLPVLAAILTAGRAVSRSGGRALAADE